MRLIDTQQLQFIKENNLPNKRVMGQNDFRKKGELINQQKTITHHQQQHHYGNYLPAQDIFLLNERIGNVTRICGGNYAVDMNLFERCLLPTSKGQSNVNTPMPIWVKPWMRKHRLFDGYSIAVYYSSHARNELGLLGFETSTGMWNTLDTSLSFDTYKGCKSLHSPSIYVNNLEKRFYMYLHGHGCPKKPSKIKNFQPTLMYTSEDGLRWNHTQQNSGPYLFWNLFYTSTPVYNSQDGHFYIMSRINDEKGVVLHRSTSLFGPFEQGPQLGLGFRHFDMLLVEGMIFVFYSMIGDHPERLLLASIDTTITTNWTDWKLLHQDQGPRILKPEYWYEHGNEAIGSTKEGPATMRHEVRDPRFLPDLESNSKHISGLLFYTVQGEKGVAMARVTIDLSLYGKSVSYINHFNIRTDVLRSSSLAQQEQNETAVNISQLLVTGVGRTGTTSVCTLMQKLDIHVSHDNNVDCGSYPGADGAVSWTANMGGVTNMLFIW